MERDTNSRREALMGCGPLGGSLGWTTTREASASVPIPPSSCSCQSRRRRAAVTDSRPGEADSQPHSESVAGEDFGCGQVSRDRNHPCEAGSSALFGGAAVAAAHHLTPACGRLVLISPRRSGPRPRRDRAGDGGHEGFSDVARSGHAPNVRAADRSQRPGANRSATRDQSAEVTGAITGA